MNEKRAREILSKNERGREKERWGEWKSEWVFLFLGFLTKLNMFAQCATSIHYVQAGFLLFQAISFEREAPAHPECPVMSGQRLQSSESSVPRGGKCNVAKHLLKM